MHSPRSRRALLRRTGTALLAGLAGCAGPLDPSGDGTGTTTTPAFTRLRETPVFVADGVTLALPDGVTRAESAADAGLVLLPPDPDVDPATAVDWLADGTVLAVVGRPADEFVIDVKQSDAAHPEFGTQGYGDPRNPVDVMGAFAVGDQFISTSAFSYGEPPSDEQVVGDLEEILQTAAEKTAEHESE
jgi:hypothetical protein